MSVCISLQILHIHNNKLSSLPEELSTLKNLAVIVLAFNHFSAIPSVLLQSQHASYQVTFVILILKQIYSEQYTRSTVHMHDQTLLFNSYNYNIYIIT